MTQYYALIGAGGFGREIMPLVADMVRQGRLADGAQPIFVVENQFLETTHPVDATCNGYPVMDLDCFKTMPGDKNFNIAIGDGRVRERIAMECLAAGMTPFGIFAGNHVDLGHNHIGDGAVFCPFTTVTANARIGKFFHANIYAYVAHDCIIGDHVTFAPRVCCNGHTIIEDHAYIGTGAIIKDGSRDTPRIIGHHAVIGMGAVVTKDVSPHDIVVGNPARSIGKNKAP